MADMNDKKEPEFNPVSRSMLIGYIILGFFCGIFGVLITWFIVRRFSGNKKMDPIMYSLIGLGLSFLLQITLMLLFGVSTADMASSMLGGSSSTSSVW